MPEITVRIIKNWDYPDWRRMSPGGEGVWDNIQFTEEPVENPDYVVVLNQPNETVKVNISPDRIWAIIQEPPTPYHRYLHRGQPGFARIYTSDTALAGTGVRYRANYPVLVWHVQKSFDELSGTDPIPPKTKNMSWITSTLSFLPGHRDRLALIEKLRDKDDIDLFGRGLNFIEDKWEALAPYRYSIVFENHLNEYYWSEKLVDCYMAGTMPVYVGCSRLDDYFPENSFVRFDPAVPDPVSALQAIIDSPLAEDRRDSLIEARQRCLHEHQLFPFIAHEIAKDCSASQPKEEIELYPRKLRHPIHLTRAVWYWKIIPLLKKYRLLKS